MDFVPNLPVSTYWKGKTYDIVLVIVDQLTKMVYDKLIKIIMNALALTEVIIKAVVRHHGLSDSIVSDWGSVFTSKFLSSFSYFLRIKQKLSTAFHPQTNGQTKSQNRTMKAYLSAFVNFESEDWAKLQPMAAKNASTNHRPLELNCSYHP